MKSITVYAPAKLNISLDITGTNDRGYHVLDMILQSITLYEKIQVQKHDTIKIKTNFNYIPVNAKNTCYKAANYFFKYCNITGGVNIQIKKIVPVRAGMGGGSADAAGVLIALDELYNTHLSKSELSALAFKVGSDVPFMLEGGTKRVQGTGEIILPMYSIPKCVFVIVMAGRGNSTPEMFKKYDSCENIEHVKINKLIDGFRKKDIYQICNNMHNVLEYATNMDITDAIKQDLIDHGAINAMMTGSGSAIFGVFKLEATAMICRKKLTGKYKRVYIAKPVKTGARIVNIKDI